MMKKSTFTNSMMLLAAGIVMASCAKTDVFEENQKNYGEQQKSEYKANYVAKYGQPDANQNWDFAVTSNAAKTRAGEGFVFKDLEYPSQFYTYIRNDKDQFANKIASAEVKTWNPYMKVQLIPSAVHTTKKDHNFALGIYYNNNLYAVCNGFKVLKNAWGYNYDPKGWELLDFDDAVCSLGRNIDTRDLASADNMFWAAFSYDLEDIWRDFIGKTNISDYKINSYKEITINGRTYWCFDCTGDGDYSNLVCLAEGATGIEAKPQPISKRYFVEDLGSKDDFDFNDIVFDVIDDNGTQKCIVRAMGGTLDFTLHIGDTEWTKSVDGVAAGYNVKTMYNTQSTIVWDKVLAEFPVTGWNPNTNNIKVKVNSSVSNDVIIEIPFPKKGEVPMIISFPTVTDWQKERESLPENWWVIPTEITEE
jgi:hypothetical protein